MAFMRSIAPRRPRPGDRARRPSASRPPPPRRRSGCSVRTPRALVSSMLVGEGGMLEGYEHAHAAGRRVDGAGEGGDEDQRIVVDSGKARPLASIRPRPPSAAGDSRRALRQGPPRSSSAPSRARQPLRRDRSGSHRSPAQRIHRQQHGDEAVAEVAHCASKVEPRDWRDGVPRLALSMARPPDDPLLSSA